jgi:hypothetical protein
LGASLFIIRLSGLRPDAATAPYSLVAAAGASMLVRIDGSNPKRIWLGTDPATTATIRPNSFFIPYEPAARLSSNGVFWFFNNKDLTDNTINPFSWKTYTNTNIQPNVTYNTEKLQITLNSYPGLGGEIPPTRPAPFITLSRWTEKTRSRFETRFLPLGVDDNTTNWRPWQTIQPQNATNNPTTWDAHYEQARYLGSDADNIRFRAVRLDDSGDRSFAQAIGGYPLCFRMAEVRTTLVTPDASGSFDDLNTCGPFDLRQRITIPPATLTIDFAMLPAQPPATQRFGMAQSSFPSGTNFLEGNAVQSYQWRYQTGWYDPETMLTNTSAWTDLPETGASVPSLELPSPGVILIMHAQARVALPAQSALAQSGCAAYTIDGRTSLDLNYQRALQRVAATQSVGSTASDGTAGAAVGTAPFGITCAPNPVSDVVTVQYQLSEESTTTCEIIDALQRVVARPIQQQQAAGLYACSIPLARMVSGMYTVRVTTTTASGARQQATKSIQIIH